MLKITGLHKKIGTKQILTSIDLEIQKGEHFFLLGPSGVGKSTLLKIIAGLESPDKGNIYLDGAEITTTQPEKRPVNTVFQNYALFPNMSVADNIAFSLKIRKIERGQIKKRVAEMLEIVKLVGYETRNVKTLSGGEQQRVAIARALINQPSILLLDEPLSAVDQQLKSEMIAELRALKEKLNTTFIHVTHSHDEALTLASRIAVMGGGKILQIDTPEKIYNQPKNARVAAYTGQVNLIPLSAITGESRYAQMMQKNRYPEQTMLFLRPEKIKLSKYEASSPVDLSGFITQVNFKGDKVEYLVSLNSHTVLAWQPSDGTYFQPGQEVFLSWNDNATIFLEA